MSNDDDYTPIQCGLYSKYEVSILHREILSLHWRDDDGLDHIDRVTPTDLQTRNHCAYLIATNSEGDRLEIRLDRIISRNKETE